MRVPRFARIARMAKVNDHYLKLKSSYLFSEIARRVREFQDAHADARIIRLALPDYSPDPEGVLAAIWNATRERIGV